MLRYKLRRFSKKIEERGVIRSILFVLATIKLSKNIKKYISNNMTLVKLVFFAQHRYWPNFENPVTFSEKIQHRKFFDYDSRYSTISDKYAVRSIISEKIGDDTLTDLYHVTPDPESIPFESLPSQYVIKPNHMSGQVIIVNDHSEIDIDEIKQRCYKWMSTTYGQEYGEYWYADIPAKIMVEENLSSGLGNAPKDYKFYVFDGNVKFVHVDIARFGNHTRRFYDAEWNPKNFRLSRPLAKITEPPLNLEQMIEIAELLGDDFNFIRVDLYETENGHVRFGELTVAPGSGFEYFKPIEADLVLGQYWNV